MTLSKIDGLGRITNDDGARQKAAQILRKLVDEIRLHPVDDALQIELAGDLVNLIGFAETPDKKTPGFKGKPGCTEWLVAGTCKQRELMIVPIDL